MKSADESPRGGWGLGRMDIGSFMRRIARVLEFTGEVSAPDIHKRTGTALEGIRAKCLEAVEKNGKLAGLVAVAEVADAYAKLEETERGGFFKMLHEDFSVDAQALDGRAQARHRSAEGPSLRGFVQGDWAGGETGQAPQDGHRANIGDAVTELLERVTAADHALEPDHQLAEHVPFDERDPPAAIRPIQRQIAHQLLHVQLLQREDMEEICQESTRDETHRLNWG